MRPSRTMLFRTIATCALVLPSAWLINSAWSQAPGIAEPGAAASAVDEKPAAETAPAGAQALPADPGASGNPFAPGGASTPHTESAPGGVVPGANFGPARVAEPAVNGEIAIYRLANASAESIVKILEKQFPGDANIAVDARTNVLIVRAPADTQHEIEALIEALDRAAADADKAAPAEDASSGRGGGGGFRFGPSGGLGGPSTGGGASRTNDSSGREAQSTVVYPIDDADADVDAIVASLVNQYGGRADIRRHEELKAVVVSAPPEMQREIRGMIMMQVAQQVAQRSRSTRRNRDDSSSSGFGPSDRRTVMYPIRDMSAAQFATLLQKQLRGNAEIRVNDRTNGVVVTASEDTHNEIRQIIQLLEQLGQRNAEEGAKPPRPYGNLAEMYGFGSAGTPSGYLGAMGAAQQAASKRMDAAVATLQSAKTDDEKQAAKDTLRQTLVEIFTADMQAREKAVKEIESRIGELRKQYEARQKVKDEIIELQLKVLENEAAGLGFPAASASGGQPRTMPRGGGSYDPPTSGSGFRIQPGTGTTLPQTGGRPNVSINEVIGQQLQNVYRHSGIDATGSPQEEADSLQEKGRLVVSPDHKLYAYVYDDPANSSGPAQIRLCAVVTGEVIVSAEADRPVGKLEYTEEGIFTREANGLLNFRLPLQLSSVGAGPFNQTTSDGGTDARSVETRLRRLLKEGHFVVSPDAKWYAYVETIPPTGSPEFLTPEATDIRVCNVATGKFVALYRANSPVGELRFTSLDAENFGVEAREADGTWKLCIQLSKRTGPEGRVYEPQTIPEPKSGGGADAGGGETTPTTALPPSAPSGTASAASSANVLGDYKLLNDQYIQAKTWLLNAEGRARERLAELRKAYPDLTDEENKKKNPGAWESLARMQRGYEQVQRMYQLKMQLLEIDVQAAESALALAQRSYDRVRALHEEAVVSANELDEQLVALETAQLDLQRAKTVYDLFRSIAEEAEEAGDAAEATGEDTRTGAEAEGEEETRGALPPDGATSSLTPESIRERRAQMRELLEAKWVCVEAAADGKALDTSEVARWELEFDFHDDSATVSYVGEDLKRVETSGNVTLDPQTSPPRFFVEVKLSDWQDPSRLSGPAIVDRGRLEMVNHGTPITLGRQFDRPPTVFEFRRLAIETAAGIDEQRSTDAPDETATP